MNVQLPSACLLACPVDHPLSFPPSCTSLSFPQPRRSSKELENNLISYLLLLDDSHLFSRSLQLLLFLLSKLFFSHSFLPLRPKAVKGSSSFSFSFAPSLLSLSFVAQFYLNLLLDGRTYRIHFPLSNASWKQRNWLMVNIITINDIEY